MPSDVLPTDTGRVQDTPASGWLALDDPQEWAGFSRPVPDHDCWQESYLAIQGMHCASCALTVEHALVQLPGVQAVQVNGASATARLTWSPAVSRPSQWLAALQRAGYGALPAGDLIDAAARVREQRLLLWRWLVAGFCMMQVMMYAWPAYVAGPGCRCTSSVRTTAPGSVPATAATTPLCQPATRATACVHASTPRAPSAARDGIRSSVAETYQ